SERAGISALSGTGCYPTRLDPRAAGTVEGRHHADPAGLDRLSCHRGRDSTTVLSRTPRGSTGSDRGTRSRTDGGYGSANAHGHNRSTVVRVGVVSAQGRTAVTAEFRQSG